MDEITDLTVHSPGDPSVGIFSQTWHLKGSFFFNDVDELDEFKKHLKIAFELAGYDDIIVLSELDLVDNNCVEINLQPDDEDALT